MFQCAGHILFSPTSTSHAAPGNLARQLEILYPLLIPALTLSSAPFLHFLLLTWGFFHFFDHCLFLGLHTGLAFKAQLLTYILRIHLFFPSVSIISQLLWGTLHPCSPKLFLPPGHFFRLWPCLT